MAQPTHRSRTGSIEIVTQPALSPDCHGVSVQRSSPPAATELVLRHSGPPDQPAPDLENQVAALLSRPEQLRSVHEPILNLRTGECAGYQSVVRVAEWPARSPHPWFTAASRTGLRSQLEAAALAASLQAATAMPGERFCAVTVSAQSLLHPALQEVLADADDLSRLLLCPTPTEAAAQPAVATELAALRARGLLVAVAAGQAGQRELTAAARLRPDVVILGPVLIRDLAGDSVRRRIVDMVTDLAGEFGAAALADGLETLDEVRQLQRAGVRLGQGWLFGRPRPGFQNPPRELAAILRTEWERRRAALPGAVPQRPEHDRRRGRDVQ